MIRSEQAFNQACSIVDDSIQRIDSDHCLEDLLSRVELLAVYNVFNGAFDRAVSKGESDLDVKAVDSAAWMINRAIQVKFSKGDD
jgi:hypothetical protein